MSPKETTFLIILILQSSQKLNTLNEKTLISEKNIFSDLLPRKRPVSLIKNEERENTSFWCKN